MTEMTWPILLGANLANDITFNALSKHFDDFCNLSLPSALNH